MEHNDLFEQLKSEHKDVKELLKKAEDCPQGERKDVLSQIESELVPHARAEEKTLYAVLLENIKQSGNSEDAEDLTNEAYEEHRAIDELLGDLKSSSTDDEAWVGKVKVLKENIEHHVDEEENELFEKARKFIEPEKLAQIAQAYNEAKSEYSESLPMQSQISEREPVKSVS